jgi:large subunit ribosomal protein L21
MNEARTGDNKVNKAIIETGGHQFTVAEGDTVKVPRLVGEVGQQVTFDRVLFAAKGDSKQVGAPTVADARVEAKIVAHGRHAKVTIYKYKKRTGYRRKRGHRQEFTSVKITGLAF